MMLVVQQHSSLFFTHLLKVALCSFGEEILDIDWFLFNSSLSWLNKLNKQTDLKGQHNFILF